MKMKPYIIIIFFYQGFHESQSLAPESVLIYYRGPSPLEFDTTALVLHLHYMLLTLHYNVNIVVASP